MPYTDKMLMICTVCSEEVDSIEQDPRSHESLQSECKTLKTTAQQLDDIETKGEVDIVTAETLKVFIAATILSPTIILRMRC